jgi:hypothetical protein
MTTLTTDKTVVRETAARHARRAIIVELSPHLITLRLKGLRDRLAVPYDALIETLYKRRAEEARREKAAKRRGRR